LGVGTTAFVAGGSQSTVKPGKGYAAMRRSIVSTKGVFASV
jgi:hypothetical protein